MLTIKKLKQINVFYKFTMKPKQNLGNPAAIMATTQLAQDKGVRRLAFFLIAGILAVPAIYFGNRELKKVKAKNIMASGTKSSEYAIRLRAAMKRWGGGFWSAEQSYVRDLLPTFSFPWDGTDEATVRKIAQDIVREKNWDKVMQDYSDMFFSELLPDLRSELSESSFNSFFGVLNKEQEKQQNIRQGGTAHFKAGDTVYAFSNNAPVYDSVHTAIVKDRYEVGERMGVITKVHRMVPSGRYVYRLDQAWCVNVPYMDRCSVFAKHDDIDITSREISGLGSINPKIDIA